MKRATSPFRNFLLLGLTAALLSAVPAHAWWNADWSSRKKITIDTGATGVPITDAIGTTPVLVRLHDGNFPFTAAKSDGSDLRFIAADDKTPLAFHLEKFDSLLNEAFVWVKIPDLKPGAQTTFWLYYGNGTAGATRIDDVKGTYDADTALVFHFTERGQPANDASGKNNNARNAGVPADGAMIGLGLKLDDKSVVSVPASPSLAWTDGAALTWSAWIKIGAPQPNAIVFSRLDGGRALEIGIDRGAPFVEVITDSGKFRSPAGAPILGTGWKHFALIASGPTLTLFLDGEPYAKMNAAIPALNSPANIGGDGANAFVGDIDELEISNIARSAGFIKFAALAQGGEKATKLIAVGEEEQPKSWFAFLKTGYVGIIIGSLSIDGWVVIGILGVMFIISSSVMIGKALYLGRVGKGNELFLELWRKVATDLSVLDAEDGSRTQFLGAKVDAERKKVMDASPLYHVYHVGSEEIRHRLEADRSSKVLSARSIQAIRASMDGALVRETHRLSSQMVLLTIAISGGPFLGLLGTVVGVMITFAAVAAAGDVNVNAIAPGIAAALAATVAGLGVAIPALFGYNYLLTRIKAAQSDLHVFIDEFVAKMAEFYSETAEANRTVTRSPFSPSEPPMPKR
jgi:biopolymer transport protein ExbB